MRHCHAQYAALPHGLMTLQPRIAILIQSIHQSYFYPNHVVTKNHNPTQNKLHYIDQGTIWFHLGSHRLGRKGGKLLHPRATAEAGEEQEL